MITNQRSTGNVTAIRRVVDIAKKIDVLEPNAAPLTQLTRKISKRAAINPAFNWLEEEALTKTASVVTGGGYTSGAVTFDVVAGQGSRFRAGDVVKVVATGEQFLVTAVSTDTLTITRAWGVTAAGSLASAGVLLIVGNANQEGATSRTLLAGDQTPKTNYTQIFRTPFGITETADNSEMYGGKDLAHLRMMNLIEHQKGIERALWFGEPKEDTSGTYPRRATGGVDYYISTNATDASGTLTESEFDDFLRTGFRYGNSTKWLFAAPIITAAISYWAKGKLLTAGKDKTYGVDVTQYVTPFGTVNIVNNNIFSETTVYAGYAFLIDLDSPSYRYLANRDTKLITNIQANDADGETDEYKTECGLEFSQEKKDAQLYNVTSYA